jgi:hypothetical protein
LSIAHRRDLITAACRAAIATTLGATVLAIAACQGSQSGKTAASSAASSVVPSSSATSASAPSPTAGSSQDDRLALQILDAIIRGDFQAATAGFDSQMKQKLTPQDLSSSWATYQEAFGKYQSHGDPQDVLRGALTVVNIPLQMAGQPGEFRVTFHPDQTVAGLYFLKAGIPVP